MANAIKFSNEGGDINFSASVSNTNHSDKKITLPETHNEPGTGLGLVLCKEFVEKHKDTISVTSEVGKGSTFVVTLPVKQGF